MKRESLGIILFIIILFISLFPHEIRVGAFDPANWHGIVIIKDNKVFAFRFVMQKEGIALDGYDTFFIVEDVGPKSPDGSYARVSFNPGLPLLQKSLTPILKKGQITREVLQIQYGKWKEGVVGIVKIPKGIMVDICFYNPWGNDNKYSFNGNTVKANQDTDFVFYPISGSLKKNNKKSDLYLEINRNSSEFFFYAGFEKRDLTRKDIKEKLKEHRIRYAKSRPHVSGEWAGLIQSIYNNLTWMKLWQPDYKRVYVPAGRRWIFPKPDGERDIWTIFEWDAFFNALEATVEDYQLAKEEIKAVLDTQYPWGNIPNWRSAENGSTDRSQPPIGAFVVLKSYYKLNDMDILKDAYPRLKKHHDFWLFKKDNDLSRRDGNKNGLLEWGSDTEEIKDGIPKWEIKASGRQRAAWESGQDDLPNFDNVPFSEESQTLKMDCLDLSALYTLDTEMLREMAFLLNKKEDFDRFDAEYKEMQKTINNNLWDKNRNFYFDRFWDGKFSSHKAASNFYPLIAGIPSQKNAEIMLKTLLNKKEFWGDFVIPTISRNNPAFKDQQYWRGTIWPPTNYLVYQGLKRYRFDQVASDFAVKSARLFLKSWNDFRLCRENYNSMTGDGGGQRYQSWGPLFALILLEDFIDYSPFEGFRVGNISAGKKSILKNISMQGYKYKLIVNIDALYLWQGSSPLLKYKGRGVLRNLKVGEKLITFEANVLCDKLIITPDYFLNHTYEVYASKDLLPLGKKGAFILSKGQHKIIIKKLN